MERDVSIHLSNFISKFYIRTRVHTHKIDKRMCFAEKLQREREFEIFNIK